METHLRPLSLGEILDRTAQLYRQNFVLFAGISSVYAGAMLVLGLLQIGLDESLTALRMTHEQPLVTLIFLVLIFPLSFIFAGAALAANNRAVAWVNLGQPATIRGAYSSILPRIGRYLWLMTIAIFVVYLPFLLLFGGYFLLIFVYVIPKGVLAQPGAGADPVATIVFGLATLALFLLIIPAFVYAILMGLRYSLAVPASVVEDLKALPALRRSIDLSKGSRGRIFVLGLLIAVIQIGLVLVTEVFFFAAAITAIKHQAQLPAWMLVIQQIVGFFTSSFIGPMYATGLTLFYYDQRIRKEGFDIEWMMQAAGLTVPAPEPPVAPQAEPWLAPDAHFEPPPAESPPSSLPPEPPFAGEDPPQGVGNAHG